MIVDGTPIDLGRDISLIKAVSDKSGIPIVIAEQQLEILFKHIENPLKILDI